MGTHPIFESDFDCLTVQMELGDLNPELEDYKPDQIRNERINQKTNKRAELSCIVAFCVLGALSRLGIDILCSPIEDYGAFPIYKSFFSNLVGCFFIGLFSSLKPS